MMTRPAIAIFVSGAVFIYASLPYNLQPDFVHDICPPLPPFPPQFPPSILMSASNQAATTSVETFTAIFNSALTEYQRITGEHPGAHPFAAQLTICHSPEAVSNVLRDQAQALSDFRKGDERLMAWLDPTVHVLFTFSAILGEGVCLPFSPVRAIFTGIGVLLWTARGVVASYDTLLHLFERMSSFLQRLRIYAGTPPTNELTELLGKIMAQLLFILALSTRALTDSRIKIFVRRLFGKTDIEDALLRLDTLTKEEYLMIAARNLEVTCQVDGVVRDVDANIKATKSLAEDIDDNVKATTRLIHDTNESIKATKALAEGVGHKVKVVEVVTRCVHDEMEAVKDVVDELTLCQLQEKLRKWLSPPDPSSNHNVACGTQLDGTAKWFIEGKKFNEWKRNGSLMWIRGNPGSGKSILCSAIIEDIKRVEGATALIAFYYFDFKVAAKRNIRGLLSSLLVQLADDSARCWEVLFRLYKACGDGSKQPSDAMLSLYLQNMLDLPDQVPIFIIADGLDECPNHTGTPSARDKVLEFVEDLVVSRHPNLRVCITSRPEQDIQNVLNPLISASRHVSLHEEGGQREDIDNYIRSFVNTDREMRRWREKDKELVIKTLSARADGMFRWVFCQLDTLRRCFPPSIRTTLDQLPTTLDETYERALQKIPKERKKLAHRLFQCLVAAIRPLRVEELAEIFAIGFDLDAAPNLVESWRPENPEEALLSACSTLITVAGKEGSKVVQFSHFSVKEFLTSDRLQTSEGRKNIRDYHIPLDIAHTSLARACLTVLLQLDEEVDKARLATFPLAFYAAQHWVAHAAFEDVASRIQGDMERLFNPSDPYLATWTWIYDVDSGQVQESIGALAEYPTPPEATALYYAVLCGFSGLANYLIVTHAEDVNAKCGDHGTPLHAASYGGHLDAVRLLLDHGANVNATNGLKKTPLCSAHNGGHLQVMRLLLERGADVDARYNPWGLVLHDASSHGQADVVRLLLQHDTNVNARGSVRWTPLHWASTKGHPRVVKLLLERGAEVDALSKSRNTPLRLASGNGRLEVARILLEHGADVHARGQFGLTPFQMAMSRGHVKVAQLLLEHGAGNE
ncbi:hypothetical protein BC826DRAFT_90964 [Russula brevipes]|nr:hypothetical protein BC826DRAFT_90964 [Russula brevipes]